MSTHSITEASNSLSKLVAKARAGEVISLTLHGREVAQIVGTERPRKRRMTEAEIAELKRFTDSLGSPPAEDAGSYVSRMRDEDWA